MTPEVRDLFQELIEKEIFQAYEDPVGYFSLHHENPESISDWQKLMQKACKEVGMDFADAKMGLSHVRQGRLDLYLEKETG